MKATKFQNEIPSSPFAKFKDHYLLRFDFISMQYATEIFRYREVNGELLRLEPKFTLPLEHVTELFVVKKDKCLQLQLTNLALWKDHIKGTTLLSGKVSLVSLFPSIGALAHCLQIVFEHSPLGLFPL